MVLPYHRDAQLLVCDPYERMPVLRGAATAAPARVVDGDPGLGSGMNGKRLDSNVAVDSNLIAVSRVGCDLLHCNSLSCHLLSLSSGPVLLTQ